MPESHTRPSTRDLLLERRLDIKGRSKMTKA